MAQETGLVRCDIDATLVGGDSAETYSSQLSSQLPDVFGLDSLCGVRLWRRLLYHASNMVTFFIDDP